MQCILDDWTSSDAEYWMSVLFQLLFTLEFFDLEVRLDCMML